MITLDIPTSKSITNRALIIDALTGFKCHLHPISTSRDSQTMQKLLSEFDNLEILDVLDAGTVMRFLAAYTAVSGKVKVLRGSDRMHERPIKILVEALRKIGAKIDYLEKEGYPPIKTKGFTPLNAHLKLAIDGSVSSQYISALLMVAPYFNEGIELVLTGKIGSRPYIQMTLDLMRHFGVDTVWKEQTIKVPGQSYNAAELTIEPDWSSASYWYSYVSLSNRTNPVSLFLNGYTEKSLQGDAMLHKIYQKLGVETEFTKEGMKLSPSGMDNVASFLSQDFSDCPDIAQTVMVTCAMHQSEMTLTGLESLRIKETDRIKAMQNELRQLNVQLMEQENETYVLHSKNLAVPGALFVHTYHDHRMAMAFAPLQQLTSVSFEDTSVVNKSYPTFWADLDHVLKASF